MVSCSRGVWPPSEVTRSTFKRPAPTAITATYHNMTTYQIFRKGGCSPCSLPCRVGNPQVIGKRETQGADAVLSGIYDHPVRFAARLAAADVRGAGGGHPSHSQGPSGGRRVVAGRRSQLRRSRRGRQVLGLRTPLVRRPRPGSVGGRGLRDRHAWASTAVSAFARTASSCPRRAAACLVRSRSGTLEPSLSPPPG